MTYFLSSAIKIATEYFFTGAMSAISLYCGTKTPKNRRKKL